MKQRTKYCIYFLIILASVLIAYGISELTGYDTLTLILGMGGLASIISFIDNSIRDQKPTPNDSSTPENNDSAESADESKQDTNKIGATSGLNVEQKRIQDELIKVAYNEFVEEVPYYMLTYQAPQLVEKVAENTNTSEDEVSKVWQFTKDDEFFRQKGNSWRITPKAIFRAEEIGEQILLDESTQEDILDLLLLEYHESPTYAKVNKNELIEALDVEKDKALQNLWYLEQKRYVEADRYMGGRSDYSISDFGRKIHN